MVEDGHSERPERGEAEPADHPPFSDHIRIEPDADGCPRYFRADDPAREEYTYRKPFILELEITRRCNLRCVHCYAEASDREFPDELTREEIGRVLDDGRELGMRELSLTGGEVMCHEEFLDIVDEGFARGYNVRFVTNGTLATDDLVAALRQRPIKLVTVSLDAVRPEAHERIRGAGTHAAAVAGIERLRAAGFGISIITAFSRLNIDEFDAILDFCVERRLDWQVQMTSAKGRCAKGITLTPDEYYALGEKVARAYTADLPINIIPMDDLATVSQLAPLSALSRTWQGRCTGGVLNVFVRANGEVTPCSALAFPPCIVGNVRSDSLKVICREERCRDALAWLTPEALTGACADCAFKVDCRGGCPEILLKMCAERTENEYCFHRIEQARVLEDVLDGGEIEEGERSPRA
jgi:radical SAM protein with 4Fe4S-binding SPASM domain